jgi:tRNA G37 N-methylase Trm5
MAAEKPYFIYNGVLREFKKYFFQKYNRQPIVAAFSKDLTKVTDHLLQSHIKILLEPVVVPAYEKMGDTIIFSNVDETECLKCLPLFSGSVLLHNSFETDLRVPIVKVLKGDTFITSFTENNILVPGFYFEKVFFNPRAASQRLCLYNYLKEKYPTEKTTILFPTEGVGVGRTLIRKLKNFKVFCSDINPYAVTKISQTRMLNNVVVYAKIESRLEKIAPYCDIVYVNRPFLPALGVELFPFKKELIFTQRVFETNLEGYCEDILKKNPELILTQKKIIKSIAKGYNIYCFYFGKKK